MLRLMFIITMSFLFNVCSAQSNDLPNPNVVTPQVDDRPHKVNFSSTPPKIIVANEPTALITIDGPPALRAVKDSTLMHVINTPFLILYKPETNTYFLRTGGSWHATDNLMGAWHDDTNPPSDIQDFESLLKDENKSGVDITNIVVSTTPAALIEIDGEPEFTPIPGTNLMYVQNTDSNIIFQPKKNKFFILISGRWYSSNQLSTGAHWLSVPRKSLPKSFAKIPSDLPISDVLASIPGTAAAQEAIRRNQTPVVKKFTKDSLNLAIHFDGEPQFENISGTNLQYAINSDKPVIRAHNRYYGNDQAVWFIANTPYGPWKVANTVPDEMYQIPPTNPLYYLTYNYIYNADNDTITVAFTPGYQGSYIEDGSVVYGTGYYYDPWIGNHYYGAPVTYGYAYEYDPSYGWYSPATYLWFGAISIGWVNGGSIWYGAHEDYRRNRHEHFWDKQWREPVNRRFEHREAIRQLAPAIRSVNQQPQTRPTDLTKPTLRPLEERQHGKPVELTKPTLRPLEEHQHGKPVELTKPTLRPLEERQHGKPVELTKPTLRPLEERLHGRPTEMTRPTLRHLEERQQGRPTELTKPAAIPSQPTIPQQPGAIYHRPEHNVNPTIEPIRGIEIRRAPGNQQELRININRGNEGQVDRHQQRSYERPNINQRWQIERSQTIKQEAAPIPQTRVRGEQPTVINPAQRQMEQPIQRQMERPIANPVQRQSEQPIQRQMEQRMVNPVQRQPQQMIQRPAPRPEVQQKTDGSDEQHRH